MASESEALIPTVQDQYHDLNHSENETSEVGISDDELDPGYVSDIREPPAEEAEKEPKSRPKREDSGYSSDPSQGDDATGTPGVDGASGGRSFRHVGKQEDEVVRGGPEEEARERLRELAKEKEKQAKEKQAKEEQAKKEQAKKEQAKKEQAKKEMKAARKAKKAGMTVDADKSDTKAEVKPGGAEGEQNGDGANNVQKVDKAAEGQDGVATDGRKDMTKGSEEGNEAEQQRGDMNGRGTPNANVKSERSIPLHRPPRPQQSVDSKDISDGIATRPDRSQHGGSLGGPRTILRKTALVLRHSPLFSLLTLATIAVWIEGSRQFAALLILSTETAAGSGPSKSGLPPDLVVTESSARSLLVKANLSATGLFFIVNLFNFICALLVGLALNMAIGRADRQSPKEKEQAKEKDGKAVTPAAKEDAWWRNPIYTITKLLSGFKVLLMGAQGHGPFTLLRQCSWKTYLRITLFITQLVLTVLLFRQVMSFVYFASVGGTTPFQSTPDIVVSANALSKAAQAISPSTAFLGIFVLVGIVIITLASSWFALLNPRPSRTSSQSTGGDDTPNARSPRLVLMLMLVAAVVITIIFLGIMYFFGQISTYTTGSLPSSMSSAAGMGKINLWGANVIFLIFVPFVGWSVVIYWQSIKMLGSTLGFGIGSGKRGRPKGNDSIV